MRMHCKSGLFGLGILACFRIAQAGAPTPFSDDLIVDWYGFRDGLRQEGIDVRVGYTSETVTNVQGGEHEGARYADEWDFAAALDLEKTLGLKHATVQLTITDRNGRNLSSDEHLDSLQQVQEIYGSLETWRITEFWYDQKYLDGLLNWKIGRLTDGEDFAAFSCDFVNFAFCGTPQGNIEGNYWYNWPVSQWGTRLKVSPTSFGYLELGAYEVDPNYLTQRYAFDLGNPPGASGALIPFEAGWLPTFKHWLAGSYKLGAWYDTSRAADVFENTAGQPLVLAGGQPRMRNGQYGAYVNLLQQVSAASQGSKRGARVFLNATLADRQTSTIDSQIAAGIAYKGPLQSRPTDEIGLAIARTHVNSRVADAERLQNAARLGPVAIQSAEYESEIYYSFTITSWLNLRPDIQYIHQPGGTAQNTDDLIIGLRISLTL
jgi:porin